MTIKKSVLISLVAYALASGVIVFFGLLFAEPTPGLGPAQSLVSLNSLAQEGIASRVNQEVEVRVSEAGESEDATQEVVVPSSAPTATTATSPASASTPSAPQPAPDPAPLACGEGGSCTVAQVATHNSPGNCWVMYASKAYNITSYTNHPGGSSAFDSSTCGTDITAQMQGTASSVSLGKTKRHSSSAYSILNAYFIANVSG